MARSGTFALVLLAPLALVSCSSDQPQGSGTQVVQVLPFAASADYPALCYQDVWEVYQDVNFNGQPDADECVGLECGDYSCPGEGGGVRAVPWPYNLQITVIRGGQVVKTVVTPSSAATSFGSLTSGDPTVAPAQGVPPNPPPGRFYLNARAVPETSAEWVRWCSGFLNVPTPNMAGQAEPSSPGICQSTTPLPWEVEVQDGDTVIVDVGFSAGALGPYVDPSFNAFMTLGGRQVFPNGITSGIGVGTHLSFSYNVH